jgi:4-hydroxy-tetrahydrodipicolinate reductase
MSIRVVHWGTGQTGRVALQGIIGHPDLELVGLIVERPENIGRDAGVLCDRPATGVIASNDIEAILALKPDCLSYFGSGVGNLDAGIANVLPFLRSGCDVVTTSFSALIHPNFGPASTVAAINAACAAGQSSFFATGIEPGFASDLLPLTLLTVVDEIRLVHLQEISDYSRYAVKSVLHYYFGFGQPADYQSPLFQPGYLIQQWGGVVLGLAEELGIEFDELREFHELALIEKEVHIAFGTVAAGTIGGLRFGVEGIFRGKPLAIIEHINFIDPSVAPHWPRGADGKDTVYKVLIEGRPTLRCELDLDCIDGEEHGLIATAMRAINGIPVVNKAAPGVLNPHDVPPRPSRNVRDR